MDDVTEQFRASCNEELRHLFKPRTRRKVRGYSGPGHVSRMGETKNMYKILVGKTDENIRSEERKETKVEL
jgi:hypothetical protein